MLYYECYGTPAREDVKRIGHENGDGDGDEGGGHQPGAECGGTAHAVVREDVTLLWYCSIGVRVKVVGEDVAVLQR